MNAIVQTTLIGLLGTGLLGILFHYLRDLSARFSRLETAVQTMGTNFTDQLKGHGERLARIEAKLDIDPPAEAA